MKKIYKVSTVIVLMSSLSSCSIKSTDTKTTVSTSTNGSTTSTSTTGTGSTTVGGISCDGVYRDGATRCYYKNIPTIQAMGATKAAINAGTPVWSSTKFTATGSGVSPNQFATDGTFNVRMIPRKASSTVAAVNQSASGKPCSAFMNNSTKLRVTFRLRQQSASSGDIGTLTSSIDTPSKVWRFTPPAGTTLPLVLEVMSVEADIRCNLSNKTLYCDYADIPLSNPDIGTIPTECVAFDLQYSTDETYDVPGESAI
jgi:hypothetical protein